MGCIVNAISKVHYVKVEIIIMMIKHSRITHVKEYFAHKADISKIDF